MLAVNNLYLLAIHKLLDTYRAIPDQMAVGKCKPINTISHDDDLA